MPGMLLPLLLATSPGSRQPIEKKPFCSRTSSKENNQIDQTQVSLAQSGMGLASVDQEWSWILPNLVVKDQVFFCHIITIIMVALYISLVTGRIPGFPDHFTQLVRLLRRYPLQSDQFLDL